MPQFDDPITAAARRAGVDPALFRLLVGKESGGRHGAVSPKGARGETQLMPATARALEQRYGINTATSEGNLLGGAYYFKEQLDRFKRPDLALSAYNSGPGGSEASGRVENFAETQNYVKSILGRYKGGEASANPITATLAGAAPSGPTAAQGGTSDPRRQLLLSLIQARRSGSTDRSPIIAQLANLNAPAAASPRPPRQPSATLPEQGRQAAGDGLQPDFADRLSQLIAASGGRLKVTSGYRTPEHQADLYAAALKKYGSEQEARKWVAPPGKSNHNKGIAADLGGDLAWAHANAERFGLHFPLANEAWHLEPIGSR